MIAKLLLHVVQGSERPLADPIGPLVHHGVKNLQTMMAHTNRVGIGKSHAEAAGDIAVVLANHVEFATQILGGCLDIRKNVADDEIFERLIEHDRTQTAAKTANLGTASLWTIATGGSRGVWQGRGGELRSAARQLAHTEMPLRDKIAGE